VTSDHRIVSWTNYALVKASLLGIAVASLRRLRRGTVVAGETEFGLGEIDPADRRLVAVEYWRASKTLPADPLGMLPSPPITVAG
jgi:hypothetical protein